MNLINFEGLDLQIRSSEDLKYFDLGFVDNVDETLSTLLQVGLDSVKIENYGRDVVGRCIRAPGLAMVLYQHTGHPGADLFVRSHEETHALLHLLGEERGRQILEEALRRAEIPIDLTYENEEIRGHIMGITRTLLTGTNTNFSLDTKNPQEYQEMQRAIDLVKAYRPELETTTRLI